MDSKELASFTDWPRLKQVVALSSGANLTDSKGKLRLGSMARILIVGYGNPLKSDDSLGWRAAEEIVRQFPSPELKVMRVHQLLPEIAEAASQAELAVFIDARIGKPAGEISCEEITNKAGAGSTYSHELSPSTIIQLARELYGRSPRAYVLAVLGECFEDGETLSPTVEAALSNLIARVKTLISSGW